MEIQKTGMVISNPMPDGTPLRPYSQRFIEGVTSSISVEDSDEEGSEDEDIELVTEEFRTTTIWEEEEDSEGSAMSSSTTEETPFSVKVGLPAQPDVILVNRYLVLED